MKAIVQDAYGSPDALEPREIDKSEIVHDSQRRRTEVGEDHIRDRFQRHPRCWLW
jgi:hypothetical protein